MRNLWNKWNEFSLIGRILVFLILGAILGVVAPQAEWIGILGNLFVAALKSVAPILVFFLVISALANAKTDGSMKTIVVLYIISTFVAAAVAVAASTSSRSSSRLPLPKTPKRQPLRASPKFWARLS